MTSTDFTYILQHPEALQSKQVDELKSILDEFPYFQPARALYLKALKTSESFKYNQELKTTAAYTTDRSILFDFITSEAFVQNEISQFIKQNTSQLRDIEVVVEDISVDKKTSIDDELTQHIDGTEGVLDPELFLPKITESAETEVNTEIPTEEAKPIDKSEVKIDNSDSENEAIDAKPEAVLELGKPLNFNQSETHSFNEWLKLTRFKPVDREPTEPELDKTITKEESDSKPKPASESTSNKIERNPSPEQAKKFALIDKFISSNPKIDPKKPAGASQNVAESQLIQPESLMTETLARIYVEQKNYKKAIQSYNILSLKYPEKSGFFADRIKAIKQIQEQNKKI